MCLATVEILTQKNAYRTEASSPPFEFCMLESYPRVEIKYERVFRREIENIYTKSREFYEDSLNTLFVKGDMDFFLFVRLVRFVIIFSRQQLSNVQIKFFSREICRCFFSVGHF